MIWECAIRDSLPGVQVFNIYNSILDKGVDNNIDVISGHGNPYCQHLAAPESSRIARTTEITKGRDNPSTYLVDRGLWSACKESRYAVQRRFGFSKWRSLYDKDPEGFRRISTRDKLDMPATGSFASKDFNLFTVFPNRDLFILRPHDIRTIGLGGPNEYPCIGERWQGFQGFQHIALEYNQEWAERLDGIFCPELDDIIRAIVRLGYHTAGDKLWFIDYTLSRRAVETSSSGEGECNAFYTDGRRFVEVDCSPDSLENWEYTERVNRGYMEKAESNGALDSINFVCKVRCALMDAYADLQLLGYGLPRQVGLLACEPLSS